MLFVSYPLKWAIVGILGDRRKKAGNYRYRPCCL